MAVGRFSNAQALAIKLIQKNGEAVTIVRKVDGVPPDPAKPWEPGAPTQQNHSSRAVFLNESVTRIVGGDLVKARKQVAYVAASGLAIDPDPVSDSITRQDGSKWQIVQVEPLKPNEDRILFTLEVRK